MASICSIMKSLITIWLIIISIVLGNNAQSATNLLPVRATPWTTSTNPELIRLSLALYSTNQINSLTNLLWDAFLTNLSVASNTLNVRLGAASNSIVYAETTNASQQVALDGLTNMFTLTYSTNASQQAALIGLTNMFTLTDSTNASQQAALVGLTNMLFTLTDSTNASQQAALDGLTNMFTLTYSTNASQQVALDGLTNRIVNAETVNASQQTALATKQHGTAVLTNLSAQVNVATNIIGAGFGVTVANTFGTWTITGATTNYISTTNGMSRGHTNLGNGSSENFNVITNLIVGTAAGLITPIDATAGSYYTLDGPSVRSPVRAIDGSGMTPNNPVISSSTATNSVLNTMWMSAGNVTNTWITFDLGSNQTVAGFHLWNYNQLLATYGPRRGVKTAGIYAGTSLLTNDAPYASAGPAWGTLVENMTFAQAPVALTNYTGEDYLFITPVTTRYIQIYITSVFGVVDTPDFATVVGISEIRFIPLARATSIGAVSIGDGNIIGRSLTNLGAAYSQNLNVVSNIIVGKGLVIGTGHVAPGGTGLITPIGATAQSTYGVPYGTATSTIDGSGMNPNNPVTAGSIVHAGLTDTWIANNTTNTWITFDLGSTNTIAGFHLWNYNHYGYLHRGIKTAGIYAGTTNLASGIAYASAGPVWGTLVENMTFAQATGQPVYTGEDYLFITPVTTRYIQIYVTSQFDRIDDPYTGISEIRFIPFIPPGTLTAVNINASKGVILPASTPFTAPNSLGIQGAHLWSDGTNLSIVLQDSAGTRTTNNAGSVANITSISNRIVTAETTNAVQQTALAGLTNSLATKQNGTLYLSNLNAWAISNIISANANITLATNNGVLTITGVATNFDATGLTARLNQADVTNVVQETALAGLTNRIIITSNSLYVIKLNVTNGTAYTPALIGGSMTAGTLGNSWIVNGYVGLDNEGSRAPVTVGGLNLNYYTVDSGESADVTGLGAEKTGSKIKFIAAIPTNGGGFFFSDSIGGPSMIFRYGTNSTNTLYGTSTNDYNLLNYAMMKQIFVKTTDLNTNYIATTNGMSRGLTNLGPMYSDQLVIRTNLIIQNLTGGSNTYPAVTISNGVVSAGRYELKDGSSPNLNGIQPSDGNDRGYYLNACCGQYYASAVTVNMLNHGVTVFSDNTTAAGNGYAAGSGDHKGIKIGNFMDGRAIQFTKTNGFLYLTGGNSTYANSTNRFHIHEVNSRGVTVTNFGSTENVSITNGVVNASKGVILPASTPFTAPNSLGIQGAHLWSDGTNLSIVLQDSAGTRTTNNASLGTNYIATTNGMSRGLTNLGAAYSDRLVVTNLVIGTNTTSDASRPPALTILTVNGDSDIKRNLYVGTSGGGGGSTITMFQQAGTSQDVRLLTSQYDGPLGTLTFANAYNDDMHALRMGRFINPNDPGKAIQFTKTNGFLYLTSGDSTYANSTNRFHIHEVNSRGVTVTNSSTENVSITNGVVNASKGVITTNLIVVGTSTFNGNITNFGGYASTNRLTLSRPANVGMSNQIFTDVCDSNPSYNSLYVTAANAGSSRFHIGRSGSTFYGVDFHSARLESVGAINSSYYQIGNNGASSSVLSDNASGILNLSSYWGTVIRARVGSNPSTAATAWNGSSVTAYGVVIEGQDTASPAFTIAPKTNTVVSPFTIERGRGAGLVTKIYEINTNGVPISPSAMLSASTPFTAPSSLGIQGAHLWSDGTNLSVVLQDSASTRTTNNIITTDLVTILVATNSSQSNIVINFNQPAVEIFATNNLSFTNYSGIVAGMGAAKNVRIHILPQLINRTVIWPTLGVPANGVQWKTNANSNMGWTTLTNGNEYVLSLSSRGTNIFASITEWK